MYMSFHTLHATVKHIRISQTTVFFNHHYTFFIWPGFLQHARLGVILTKEPLSFIEKVFAGEIPFL